MSLFSYLGIACLHVTASAWTYIDDMGQTFTGIGTKPKIICHVDACESLWSMGVREDQLVGYFGHGGDRMYWQDELCHGNHCMQAHFELMTSVDGAGWYDIDMAKINSLNADIMVDYAYGPLSQTNFGILGYSPQLTDLMSHSIQIIHLIVSGRGFVEVVESVQRLAVAVGDAPNYDTADHCERMRTAMTQMSNMGRTMWANKVRVMAASFAADIVYAAQPTDDAILTMLYELGVPMTFINVTDPRGGYWEYIPLPEHDRRTANAIRPGGHPMYKVDVWLYDSRNTRYHEEDINITDPAWQAGQYAHWPIDSAFSYERAARILNTLHYTFKAAQRVTDETTCTLANDINNMQPLQPGEWPCNAIDQVQIPECPTPSTTTSTTTAAQPTPTVTVTRIVTETEIVYQQAASSDDDGVAAAAVAGIAIGCALVGVCLGVTLSMICMRRSDGLAVSGNGGATKYGKSDM